MTFQPPKGTRDFFPEDMAVRHHIDAAWRRASIRSGFDEIEGPTFEHLDLYQVKSGEGIVSELFSFRRSGGETDYALRPEFTPTLARMAAAKGRSLSLPTKWFALPSHFRAERPQRGRLREFRQWNVDLLGVDSPSADAEVIATAVAALADLGLTPEDVVVRISHRDVAARLLQESGVAESALSDAFDLLDRRDRITDSEARAAAIGLDLASFDEAVAGAGDDPGLATLQAELDRWGVGQWCRFDFSTVRGLAYYTGVVFEIHTVGGDERAIAGGGRYDGLVELFGGPSMPAVGFGMGDVVLGLLLKDKGLVADDRSLLPRPDAFVISSGGDADHAVVPLVAALRSAGLHARMSYRATRNIGKLLTEASKVNARFAVILGDGAADGMSQVKNLDSGVQEPVAINDIPAFIDH
jgi:histidyl-tRNA synthetase